MSSSHRVIACVALLLCGIAFHREAPARGHLTPGISLPKQLEWGMNGHDCWGHLGHQGIDIGMDERLPVTARWRRRHPGIPEWYGDTDWYIRLGEWRFESPGGKRLPKATAQLFFDPNHSLQCLRVRMDLRRRERFDRGVEAFAKEAYAELGRKYGGVPRGAVGRRCTWRDELGYAVSLSYRPGHELVIEYSAPSFREAEKKRSEF